MRFATAAPRREETSTPPEVPPGAGENVYRHCPGEDWPPSIGPNGSNFDIVSEYIKRCLNKGICPEFPFSSLLAPALCFPVATGQSSPLAGASNFYLNLAKSRERGNQGRAQFLEGIVGKQIFVLSVQAEV